METEAKEGECSEFREEADFPWDIGVFDAHCHPTDLMASVGEIPSMRARALTIMSTRTEDQELVAQTADRFGPKPLQAVLDHPPAMTCSVIPSFGWHPWFSHQLFDDTGSKEKAAPDKIQHYKSVLTPEPQDEEFLMALPDPRPLSHFLEQTEAYLQSHPLALVGEIGLDRAFRIPKSWSEQEHNNRDENATPGSRQGRGLSPYRVSMIHQKKILKAQLQLAGKLGRPTSIHSVQAHGAVFQVLEQLWAGHEKEVISNRQRKRRGSVPDAHEVDDELDESDQIPEKEPQSQTPLPFPPRICLHSYSGSPQSLQQFLRPSVPSDLFFSFSACINFSNPSADKVVQVIKDLHEDRLLVESDLHCAGDEMDRLLEDVVRRICRIKNWPLEKGLRRFRENWERFVHG
jgi:Tat protein secretion system quality control protein TatD with DNase activity